MKKSLCLALLSLSFALPHAVATGLPDRHAAEIQYEDDAASTQAPLPPGATLRRDVPYGSDPLQRMDVYIPAQAQNAPVIFMVHGGGWRRGDKASRTVVDNKMSHWVSQGYLFISVNYRMLPEADPAVQAEDVAKALATAQTLAPRWGGNPSMFLVMGHSAGAHLVALLSSDPARAYRVRAQPWLGTVALDSAAMDVPRLMQQRHLPLYDEAFGNDPTYWRSVSPLQSLTAQAMPLLAVCSSRRRESCENARLYAAAAERLGVRVSILPEDLSHREINDQLGLPGSYTSGVEQFMKSLGLPVAEAQPIAEAQHARAPLRRRFLRRE